MVKFVLLAVFFSYILLLYIPQFPSLHSLIYEKTLKIMALLLIFALCYFSLTSLSLVLLLLIFHLIMIFFPFFHLSVKVCSERVMVGKMFQTVGEPWSFLETWYIGRYINLWAIKVSKVSIILKISFNRLRKIE